MAASSQGNSNKKAGPETGPAFSFDVILQSAFLQMRDRVRGTFNGSLCLLVRPFLLDGLARFFLLLLVRCLVRHGVLPRPRGTRVPLIRKLRLFHAKCNCRMEGLQSQAETSATPTKRVPTPSNSLRTNPGAGGGISAGL